MAYLLQLLANALPLAALYALLSFGYSIAFAVTKRADITYGAIFAFAGHCDLLAAYFGWNRLWLVLPAALPGFSVDRDRACSSGASSCCRWPGSRTMP
jgi:branched-chain amino acid transport system permease protein